MLIWQEVPWPKSNRRAILPGILEADLQAAVRQNALRQTSGFRAGYVSKWNSGRRNKIQAECWQHPKTVPKLELLFGATAAVSPNQPARRCHAASHSPCSSCPVMTAFSTRKYHCIGSETSLEILAGYHQTSSHCSKKVSQGLLGPSPRCITIQSCKGIFQRRS